MKHGPGADNFAEGYQLFTPRLKPCVRMKCNVDKRALISLYSISLLYITIVFIESQSEFILLTLKRGSSVVERRTRNRESPSSNPTLLPFRRLGIFVLSIVAPVDPV